MATKKNNAEPVAVAEPEPVVPVRAVLGKLRDPRQNFDAKAPMVWRRPLVFDGVPSVIGALVDSKKLGPRKLRNFWRAGVIELRDWPRK